MKKLVSAGEILVEIMAERIGQSFLEPGPLLGPFRPARRRSSSARPATLGQPCRPVSAVGEDDFGQLNIERLRTLGADVSAIAVHKGHATGTAFVAYRADGTALHLQHPQQRRQPGRHRCRRAEHAGRRDHVHVMGSSLFSDRATEVALSAIQTVKAKGGTVSFDPNIRREIMQASGMREALDQVLRQTDSSCRAATSCSCSHRPATKRARSTNSCARGVLHRSQEGRRWRRLPRPSRHGCLLPGFAVDEVDPTGAGDCFGAAFVSFWLRGADPVEALRIANACGALAVTARGRWKALSAGRGRGLRQPPPGEARHERRDADLPSIAVKRARARKVGIASVCSAHPLVIEAALRHGAARRLRCADRGDLQPGQPRRRLHRHDAGRLPQLRRGACADSRLSASIA